MTPLARLHDLGATGPGFIAIHGVHLTAADVDLLAVHGGHVVHCPASNMKLGSGIAPVATLAARSINLALGTDGAASNNRLDLFGEMRLAALLAKVAAARRRSVSRAPGPACGHAGRCLRARPRAHDRLAGSGEGGRYRRGRPFRHRRAPLLRSGLASRSRRRARRRDRRVGRRDGASSRIAL